MKPEPDDLDAWLEAEQRRMRPALEAFYRTLEPEPDDWQEWPTDLYKRRPNENRRQHRDRLQAMTGSRKIRRKPRR